jgi:P pilus assembly chaperone PapD
MSMTVYTFKRFKARIAAMAAAFCVAGPVAAFDLTPVVTVIELPRHAAGVTLTLRNPRTVELPVTFEMFERTVAEDGSETRTPADAAFLVFPPQAVVQPGSSQAVRVQYVGDVPETSRSFTLFAAEAPVDLSRESVSGVQTIFRIGASIHLAPSGSVGRAELVEARPVPGGVRVTIANEGDRFFYIDDMALDFGGSVLQGPALGDIAERTLVTPGARRSFVVPGVVGEPDLRRP